MTMEQKRLFVPFSVKALSDDTSSVGEFEGYGSVFGNVDFGGDIVQRGAFTKSLDKWRSKNMLPQMLYYHDMEKIIGDWTEMVEDEYGLKVKGRLWVKGDLRVEEAVMAYNVLRGTSVKGLSIGYRVKDYEMQEQMDGGAIRVLKEVELLEVSIAPYAMNEKAEVSGVKSLLREDGSILTKREVEEKLRDAGLSRRQAKAFISNGYDAAFDRDDSEDEAELLKALKELNSAFGG